MDFSLQHCCRNLSLYFALNRKLGTSTNSTKNLLNQALNIFIPQSAHELAKYLCRNIIFHKPGDVLVLEKPYGISCLGYKQPSGGIFVPSRYDQRDGTHLNDHKKTEDDITIEKTLPIVARTFKENDLHFCIGLKRYVSGPIVLPCNPKAYEKIKNSFYYANSITNQDFWLYKALAICFEHPPNKCGVISGYATFQKSRSANEYVFVQDQIAKKRARSGKFAIQGSMYYEVLAKKNGCSLINLHFTKFSRHLPRLILSHLGCPILGDKIYTSRLVQIDDKPITMEAKDRWRSLCQPYIPKKFMGAAGIETFEEIQSQLPLYLAVYQSTLPLFGNNKKTKHVELISRTPPPTMSKLLNMELELQSVLEACQENQEGKEMF